MMKKPLKTFKVETVEEFGYVSGMAYATQMEYGDGYCADIVIEYRDEEIPVKICDINRESLLRLLEFIEKTVREVVGK